MDFKFNKPFYAESELLKIIPIKRSTFFVWQSEWIMKGNDPKEMGKVSILNSSKSKRAIVYWDAKKYQRDLARTLNYSWRHFKKYQDRYKRWKKRQERFERTLEKHRQEYEEKKIQKILKRKERKVKIKARDITWISY